MNALTSTFFELLSDNLAVRPGKTAVIDDDRSVSFAELAAEVDRLAAYLSASGIVAGDRVIVHLRKSIRETAAMFAVAQIGAVVVNVNTQWTVEQLAYVAGDSGARLMIVEPQAAKKIGTLPPSVERVLVWDAVSDERFDTLTALPASGNGKTAVRLDSELAMIIYTSGSTGKPKGVMLSHRNIVAGARSVARYLGLGESDRLLSVLPYSFDYGLNQLTTMMLVGGTIVHQPVPMAAELVKAINRHQITGLAAVPPLWAQLVRLLDAQPTALPSLRRVTNSGGKIPPAVLKRFPKVFPGVDIYLMYGLTEAFRSTFLQPTRFATKPGSIGRAIPGVEVFVVRKGVGLAGPGEEGELVHRGPLVSLGYWGQPELTASKIKPCPELAHLIGDEKVVYSGDTVRIDADGDLWFIGRDDAMIKTSGFRLSPDEVEDLAYGDRTVAEAVAFGMDDDELGQSVHIVVTALSGFDQNAFLRHCRKVMPHYMVPRHVHVWPGSMPRTASGKLDRPTVVARCRTASEPQPILRSA